MSGLQLLRPELVKQAYESCQELGLFSLFLPEMTREKYRAYANSSAQLSKPISKHEFNVYIALEMAMGIVRLRRICDYWSKRMFLGQ